MTQNNDHDFQQFRGAFDDAMIPDADFKAKMEKFLQNEKQVEPEQTSTVLASPSKKQSETVVPPRRSHPLMIAVAILMVFSVVIASVWVLSGDVLEGEYASDPSGIATLPADAPGTPGPDVQMETKLLIPYKNDSFILGVLDGVIYTTHHGPDTQSNQDLSASFITATHAESGEQLWQVEGYSLWDLNLADGVLVSYRSTFQSAENGLAGGELTPNISVVALNAKTGELLWEQEQDGLEIQRMWDSRLLTIDDMLITVNASGEIKGMDVHTGNSVWQSTFDPGQGWPTEIRRGSTTISTDMYSVSMTEWNGQIAIANGDGLIQLIDSKTGDTLVSQQISGKSSRGYLTLNPLSNGLLLTHGGESYQMVAFEPETGNVYWEREFDGDITVETSQNGQIAVNSHIWESGSLIMRLLGRGGHSTHQFTWIDGETGEDVLTTERGRVDNPVFMRTDGTYLCVRGKEFVCYDRVGTKHVVAKGPYATAFLSDGGLAEELHVCPSFCDLSFRILRAHGPIVNGSVGLHQLIVRCGSCQCPIGHCG